MYPNYIIFLNITISMYLPIFVYFANFNERYFFVVVCGEIFVAIFYRKCKTSKFKFIKLFILLYIDTTQNYVNMFDDTNLKKK